MKRVVALACLILAGPAGAKPLITSSEDSLARLCLSGEDAAVRVVSACGMALDDQTLTPASRSELLTALAAAEFDLGAQEKAEAAYRAAIAADPRNYEAMNGLGWILWDRNAFDAAAEVFRGSVDIHGSGNGLSGYASAAYRSGAMALEEAVEMLDAAISIDPQDNWSHREKGWLLRQNGRLEAAQASFVAALAIDGNDENAHYGMGRTLADLGSHEAALAAYGQAIALNKREAGPYLYRSYSLRMLDRNAQAMRDGEAVIALAPDYSGGYVEKALALVALKQRSQALAIFDDAHGRGIADNYFLYWYADTLSEDGQNERALAVIDEALNLDGREAVDYSLKAHIANRLEQFDTALAAAEIAMDRDPELAYAHYHAAVALLGQGDTDEGLKRFDVAMTKGLPRHMVGEFASALAARGKYLAAIALRGKY